MELLYRRILISALEILEELPIRLFAPTFRLPFIRLCRKEIKDVSHSVIMCANKENIRVGIELLEVSQGLSSKRNVQTRAGIKDRLTFRPPSLFLNRCKVGARGLMASRMRPVLLVGSDGLRQMLRWTQLAVVMADVPDVVRNLCIGRRYAEPRDVLRLVQDHGETKLSAEIPRLEHSRLLYHKSRCRVRLTGRPATDGPLDLIRGDHGVDPRTFN